MTVKPVDVFMAENTNGEDCPICISAIFDAMLMGTFQEMDALDMVPWADVSYTGFIGEVGPTMIVLDVGPSCIVATVHDDDNGLWVVELTGEFLAENKR